MSIFLALFAIKLIKYALEAIYYDNFLGERKYSQAFYLIYYLLLLSDSLASLNVDVAWPSLILSIAFTGLLSLLYYGSLNAKAFHIIAITILSLFSQVLNNVILGRVFKLNLPYFLELIIPCGFLAIFILVLVKICKGRVQVHPQLISSLYLGLIIYMLVSINKVHGQEIISYYEYHIYNYLALIFILFLFFISKVSQDMNIQQLRYKTLEKETSSRKEYYQELAKKEEEIRKMRHDFKNRMTSILASEKDLRAEIQATIEELDKNSSLASANPMVNYLIFSKIKGLKIPEDNLSIHISLSQEVKIDPGNLGIVLGNSLDNAREALAYLPEEERVLKILISLDMDILHIYLENSYDPKQRKAGHQGLGLKSIEEIAKTHEGFLEIEAGETFKVNIYIINNKSSLKE